MPPKSATDRSAVFDSATPPYHAALNRFEQELKSGVTEKQFTFLAEATSTLDRQTGTELTDSRKKARQIITDAYRATTDSEKALRHEAEVRLAAETAELKQIRQQFEDRLNSILAEQPKRDTEQREKTAATKLSLAKTLLAKNKTAGQKMLAGIAKDFDGTSAAKEAQKLLKEE